MREIAKGVYCKSYCSGNVGCVATSEGAVLVDSPMLPNDAWAWLKKIGPLTKQGIALLINTDFKVERVLGNCFFPASATIAHQLAWTELQRYDEAALQRNISHIRDCPPAKAAELSKTRIVLPELTLTSDMTVYRGERVLHLIHVGGHTAASIMVHLPEEGVLFTGDVVVNGEHPSLAHATSIRWLHALEMIRRLSPVDIIVPGRGEPCGPEVTDSLTQYVTTMRDRTYACFVDGCTRRETVDRVRMEGFFSPPASQREEVERRVRASVERVYDEFKKETDRKRR